MSKLPKKWGWISLNYEGPGTPEFHYVDMGLFFIDVVPVGESQAKEGADWLVRLNTECDTLDEDGPYSSLELAKERGIVMARTYISSILSSLNEPQPFEWPWGEEDEDNVV